MVRSVVQSSLGAKCGWWLFRWVEVGSQLIVLLRYKNMQCPYLAFFFIHHWGSMYKCQCSYRFETSSIPSLEVDSSFRAWLWDIGILIKYSVPLAWSLEYTGLGKDERNEAAYTCIWMSQLNSRWSRSLVLPYWRWYATNCKANCKRIATRASTKNHISYVVLLCQPSS